MDKPTFISQHSDDGKMMINIKDIQAYDVSRDGFNAKVLLSDGKWIRVAKLYTDLIKLMK